MRVLMITSEWPSLGAPEAVPFVVRQVEYLRRAGVDIEVLHFRGARNPCNYWHAWRQVQERLSNGHFDLIHAQWGQSAIAALPNRVPVVITFRGSDLQGIRDTYGRVTPMGWVLRLASQWVAGRAGAVILVARQLALQLPVGTEYHLIPAGIDLSTFQPMSMMDARVALGLPMDKKLVLFVGGRERIEKRLWLAEDTVALLQVGVPVQLVIAERVPPKRMPQYMNACDALIVTSSSEGSPNVVKEALACNLPIVSTDVGDVRERIGGVEGCIVCGDDRPKTIASALKTVLDRGGRIDGRGTVLDLDERLVTQKVIAVYEAAIAGRRN